MADYRCPMTGGISNLGLRVVSLSRTISGFGFKPRFSQIRNSKSEIASLSSLNSQLPPWVGGFRAA